LEVGHKTDDLALYKNIIVAESMEVKTGWCNSSQDWQNLLSMTDSYKALLPVMMVMNGE
jgi:hypothetical protein